MKWKKYLAKSEGQEVNSQLPDLTFDTLSIQYQKPFDIQRQRQIQIQDFYKTKTFTKNLYRDRDLQSQVGFEMDVVLRAVSY
jgi:hypothetical protein